MFTPEFTYRFMYEKVDPATFLGHLDLVRAFGRAVRRSELPVCYSRGFTQRPLVSFGPPLPFGDSGMQELVDVRLEAWMSAAEAADAINAGLPGGVRITRWALLDAHEPSIGASAAAADHAIDLPIGRERAEEAMAALESAGEFWIDIIKGEKRKRKNLKDFVARLRIDDCRPGGVTANMRIRFLPRGTVPAREAAAAVFGLSDEEKSRLEIVRVRFFRSLDPTVALFIP
ncbi:MAG: TIGR03936 family radical SAM-associated protein [Candidatus Tritonobacter lacicola]|nr:TIGR03936 family radical SAM-associated protein [Candidatus Tritonobacter lacicola]